MTEVFLLTGLRRPGEPDCSPGEIVKLDAELAQELLEQGSARTPTDDDREPKA